MRLSGGLPYYNAFLYSSHDSSCFHIYKSPFCFEVITLLFTTKGFLCKENDGLFFCICCHCEKSSTYVQL